MFMFYFVLFKGFDNFAEEVGISRDSSLKKEMSLEVEFDEKDQMKVSMTGGWCLSCPCIVTT